VSRSRIVVEALLLFLAFFLPGFVGQAGLASTGPVSTLGLVESILAGVPQFLLMAYVAGVTGPTSSPRWGLVRFEPRDILRVALLVGACFVVIGALVAAMGALPEDWTKTLVSGYRWGLQGPEQIPLALLFGLTAGYREEFFFRAYLLGRLEELGSGISAAVIVSTALFCMGHVYEGPLGIIVALTLGLVLAVAYTRRRSLHVVALAHGLYNTIVLLIGLFAPRALPVGTGFRMLIP
jgi:uncharacterized protein